jgi:hypothetical protein
MTWQLCLRQMPTSRFWRIDAVVFPESQNMPGGGNSGVTSDRIVSGHGPRTTKVTSSPMTAERSRHGATPASPRRVPTGSASPPPAATAEASPCRSLPHPDHPTNRVGPYCRDRAECQSEMRVHRYRLRWVRPRAQRAARSTRPQTIVGSRSSLATAAASLRSRTRRVRAPVPAGSC